MLSRAISAIAPFLAGAGLTLLALSWLKDRIRP